MTVVQRGGRAPLSSPAIRRLLTAAGRSVGGPLGEVTVLFTGDAELRRLNAAFRGKNRPTDVLSFPDGRASSPREAPRIGDIAISLPAARRNATRAGHGLRREVRQLLIHGFLHLLGYDHEVDGGEMHELERALHERLGGP